MLEIGHAALANKLNLTSDQRKRFYAFLREKSETRSDVYSAARSQGLRDRKTIQLLVKQHEVEIDQSMRESMGPEIYNAYQHYKQSRSARHFAGLVEKILVNSLSPLTGAQCEHITEIMYRTRVQPLAPANQRSNPVEDQMALGTGVDNPRAFSQTGLAQSKAILPPNQYEALEGVSRELEARMKMSELIQAEVKKVTNSVP